MRGICQDNFVYSSRYVRKAGEEKEDEIFILGPW